MTFKKNTYNNNFEEWLKNEADEFSAFPSQKVWEEVNKELHPQKKWSILPLFLIFILSSLIVISYQFYPKSKILADNNLVELKKGSVIAEEFIINENSNHELTSNSKIFNERNKNITIKKDNKKNVTNFKGRFFKLNRVNDKSKLENNIEFNHSSSKYTLAPINNINENKFDVLNSKLKIDYNNIETINYNKKPFNELVTKQINTIEISKEKNSEKKQHKSKWKIALYTTPSISYRVLEDEIVKRNSINVNNNNLEETIYQKPSLGTELGISFLYPISKRIFVKTGLQFNMRKYQIQASDNIGIAQVTLISNNQFISSNQTARYSTNISNSNVELNNTIYQISIPIGLQWQVIDGEKWGFIASASVQPTFSLNKTLYAVSTDYKYYIDGSQYARRGNLNTALEFLLSYKQGKNTLVMGPQIRYQQMSTFKDLYPIKEHRIDYGFKLGIITTL